ncbi:RDD family protein [Kitasatospora camelliae]|uniref:RDD family protein n=1 Tax=Kitasatospora camelliae TaxID=3156397 RepID=A0AAU8JXL1_9ACTN
MSYPPDPNNPYGQQPPPPGYGYPQQAPPPAPGYGYPQQAPPQPGYGAPQGYGIPQQPGYGHAGQVQQFYAGWGSRVAAYFVDSVVISIPAGILYGIGIALAAGADKNCTTKGSGSYTYQVCTTETPGAAIAVMALGALVAIVLGFWLLYQEGKTGQTPGKKMVNIRVVRESDGQPLGFGMAFVRKLCHILDSFACYLGWLWPIWDAKKQTFADKVMSTVVVKS